MFLEMFTLKSMVMNYFHLEEHGDELLIVDVAVSVQVCLLYQLLGRDSSQTPGLHKLWYPGIRDRSTWSKFGAHGEHGDVFLFSNLGAV